MDLFIPLLAIGGLYWFSASFFLAKRSLPQKSTCDEALQLVQDVLGLTEMEAALLRQQPQGDNNHKFSKNGCWLDRRVDSLVILVVDALRFDFARYHLPLSIGSRIDNQNHTASSSYSSSSQLLQFVADPPTVTMQRLKGLTTGSLPTFADISGNFGGSSIDEDSWVQQLKDVSSFAKRGLQHPSRLGFVGDDTWVDLFPTQFEESFPFPSFNTRDLETVDNGCLEHLPGLLQHLRTKGDTPEELEVVVSHFLGVDHVGHTYGPNDEHMDAKLRQIDAALATTLEVMDESEACHVAFIFGDHGMTEDGNHGGGTDNEVNAALFAHFSPACGDSDHNDDKMLPADSLKIMGSKYIQDAFQSIHQIDLVPTISILLGLPIPYANLGGIAPSLLGLETIRETAAALALNAAQVWRYFTVYSETANKLPNLPELQDRLNDAIAVYKEALAHTDADDSNAFYKACGLFKVFLVEASELGHRVWTRFDTVGMVGGGFIVFVTLMIWIMSLFFESGHIRVARNQLPEIGLSGLFVFFQCGMLSFSNSYIEAEQGIVMFMIAVIGMAIFIRMNGVTAGGNARIVPYIPLLIPLISRCAELVVSGHGMDPSLRLHLANSPWMFLPSLIGLMYYRAYFFKSIATKVRNGLLHTATDCITLLILSVAWLEKRSPDDTRNGFSMTRAVIVVLIISVPLTILEAIAPIVGHAVSMVVPKNNTDRSTRHEVALARALAVVAKLLIAMMVVTGPATGTTVLLISLQGWLLYILGGSTGFYEVKIRLHFIGRSTACKSILIAFCPFAVSLP